MAVQVDHPTPPNNATTISADMPGDEELCLADGTISPLDPVLDDYPEVYLYNENVGGPVPNIATMIEDPTRTATVDSPPIGSHDRYWHAARFSGGQRPSTANLGPNNPNNTLYVLTRWWRNKGNGLYDEIFDPAQPMAVNYRGVEGNCDQRLLTAAAKKKSAKHKTTRLTVVRRRGDWVKHCEIPAATGGGPGYLLVDEHNHEIRASRIEIYAFNVDWTYTHLRFIPESQRVARHVRRPLGDIVSNDDTNGGAGFFPKSPRNSLILWQADQHFDPKVLPRLRTVIVSQSKKAPDIIDLDRDRPIYLHLNYQRGIPLDVAGTFSVAIKVVP